PEAARLHVGGLALEFWADADEDGADDLVMTCVADATLGLAGGEALLDVELVATDVTLVSTSLDVEDPSDVEVPLEGLLSTLLPGILGDALSGGFGEMSEVTVVGSGPVGDRAALYLDLDLLAAPAR